MGEEYKERKENKIYMVNTDEIQVENNNRNHNQKRREKNII